MPERGGRDDDRPVDGDIEDFGVPLADVFHPQPVAGIAQEHAPQGGAGYGAEESVLAHALAPQV